MKPAEFLNELSNDTLASYKKKAGADATAADKEGDTKKADKRFSGIVKATKKQFANDAKGITEMDSEGYKGTRDDYELGKGKEYQGKPAKAKDVAKDAEKVLDKAFDKAHKKDVKEAYNNYHANRTGFSRGQRDDERHDLDVQQSTPQVWGLKINGKVWSKDGKYVTFKTKEAALNIRNSILKNRPDLEIGLVTRSGVAEDELDENCWKGYHKEGNKELFGKTVPNCVKNEDVAEGSLEEYGDTNKGQKMLGKVHQRAADRVTSKQADKDPAYARKAQQTQDRAWDRLAVKEQGVAEEQHSCPHCGGEMVSEELMNEKKDACYYKVKSRYKVWPSAYASGALVKCRKKGADSWGNGGKKNESSILEGIERADENLHKWFKEKWVRFGPDGKIRGDCARGDDSEGKPKCLPQSKAHSLGKKGRASAASRKRREDPNPERSGKAINVNTKKKSNESIDEGWKDKLGAAALAGSMALGAGAAHSRVTPDGQGGFTGGLKPTPTVTAPSDDKPAAEAPKGFSKEYLQKAADPNRTGRYMISVEKAQELLKQMNEDQLDEKWSQKYKDSINCSNPKGFSQRAHCQGKNK